MREHFYTYPTVVELPPRFERPLPTAALERPPAPSRLVGAEAQPQMRASGTPRR